MTVTRSAFIVPILALAGWAAVPAQAATTIYDRDGFLATMASKDLRTENYDSSPLGALANSTNVIYSTNGEPIVVTDQFKKSSGANQLGSGGNAFFEFNQTVTFTFAMPIVIFAIDINTWANFDGAFKALLNTGDIVSSLYDPFATSTSAKTGETRAVGQFVGFSSDTPFSSITLAGASQDKDSAYTYTLDTLKYVPYVEPQPEPEPEPAPVPLPAGLPILLSALVALGLVRRR